MCYIVYMARQRYTWASVRHDRERSGFVRQDRDRSSFVRQNPGRFAVEPHIYYYGFDSDSVR